MRGSVVLQGSWRVTVVRKDSHWAQRVVVTGAASGVIPGVVGASETMTGDTWSLAVEHDWGAGWQPSEYVHADPVKDRGARASRIVVSKDHYWPDDSHPDDLVLLLDHVGGTFVVSGAPLLVDEDLREDAGQARFLAVTVRNSGYRAFGYDTVLDVTDASRDALARNGVVVEEDWSPEALRTTGQETYGRAVGVPPLDPGGQGVAYFPVRADAGMPAAEVDVELVLTCAGARARQVARMTGVPPAGMRSGGMPSGEMPVAGTPLAGMPLAGTPLAGASSGGTPVAGTPVAETPLGRRRAPGATSGLTVSGDVIGVHASTRPPAGRTAPAAPASARPATATSGTTEPGPTATEPGTTATEPGTAAHG